MESKRLRRRLSGGGDEAAGLELEEIRHEMIISGSFWRKTFVTAVAAVGFVSFNEVTALDSKYAARHAILRETTARPAPGARLAFSATAYCKGLDTASGVAVQSGIVAADPELLPVGTVIEVDSLLAKSQRHLHCARHRSGRSGPSDRRLHVELQRGAAVRAPTDSPQRAAPRLEPARDDADVLRSDVQAPGTSAAPVASAAAGCFATCAIVRLPSLRAERTQRPQRCPLC